jgi:hypothetical protein
VDRALSRGFGAQLAVKLVSDAGVEMAPLVACFVHCGRVTRFVSSSFSLPFLRTNIEPRWRQPGVTTVIANQRIRLVSFNVRLFHSRERSRPRLRAWTLLRRGVPL